jgi:hypothetical protein
MKELEKLIKADRITPGERTPDTHWIGGYAGLLLTSSSFAIYSRIQCVFLKGNKIGLRALQVTASERTKKKTPTHCCCCPATASEQTKKKTLPHCWCFYWGSVRQLYK